MSDLAKEAIVSAICKQLHLHPKHLSRLSLELAMRRVMRKHRLESTKELLDSAKDPKVQKDLLEAGTVPESYFFRYPSSFRFLQSRLSKQQREEPVRILSLGCATGEEVYSIALCLERSGRGMDNVLLEGVDINESAVRLARKGVYGERSFRSCHELALDPCFRRCPLGLSIVPRLRRNVSFRVANLLCEDLWPQLRQYDYIFCRNVLLYLDESARRTVIERVARHARPGATLFTGPSEVLLFTEAGWQRHDAAGSFALYRGEGADGRG